MSVADDVVRKSGVEGVHHQNVDGAPGARPVESAWRGTSPDVAKRDQQCDRRQALRECKNRVFGQVRFGE